MKEAEFYGIKVQVEDVPLGFYVFRNPDVPSEDLVYGERDVSFFEGIAKQVPRDDFIETLKQMIKCTKVAIEDGVVDIISPENREHNFKALRNTEKTLTKILDALSK